MKATVKFNGKEYIVVKPAYGKELNSEKEALQHYLDGKDFMILSLHHGAGSYLNILDCERAKKPISLQVRFGKKSQKLQTLPSKWNDGKPRTNEVRV